MNVPKGEETKSETKSNSEHHGRQSTPYPVNPLRRTGLMYEKCLKYLDNTLNLENSKNAIARVFPWIRRRSEAGTFTLIDDKKKENEEDGAYAKADNMPSWDEKFLSNYVFLPQQNKYIKKKNLNASDEYYDISVAGGTFKTIYKVKSSDRKVMTAVSLEIGNDAFLERRKFIFKLLKALPKGISSELLTPQQAFPVKIAEQEVLSGRKVSYHTVWMVYELCDDNDLWHYQMILDERNMSYPKNELILNRFTIMEGQSESKFQYLFRRMLELTKVLKSLHYEGIALVDIKPENILKCGGDYKFADVDSMALISDAQQKEMPLGTLTLRYSGIFRTLRKIFEKVTEVPADVSCSYKRPNLVSPRVHLRFLLLEFTDFHAMAMVILETLGILLKLRRWHIFSLEKKRENEEDGAYVKAENMPSWDEQETNVKKDLERGFGLKQIKQVKNFWEVYKLCWDTLSLGYNIWGCHKAGNSCVRTYDIIKATVEKWKMLGTQKGKSLKF